MGDGFADERESHGIKFGANRRVHLASRAFVRGKQRLHLLPQFRVMAADLVEQRSAMLRIGFRRTVKQFLDLCPTFRSQTAPSRFASRCEARLRPSSNPVGP